VVRSVCGRRHPLDRGTRYCMRMSSSLPTRASRLLPLWAATMLAVTAVTTTTPQLGAQRGPPATPSPVPIPYPSTLPTGRVTYRTLSETYHEIEQIAARYPATAKRFELSHRSLLGQRMWGLEISHDVNASSGKPVFLMTGLHHAREWPTVELTMEFAWDVLKSDGTDARITALLDSVRLILVPVVNPDGYDMSRTLNNEQKRKSCRIAMGQVPTWAECAAPTNVNAGVDLNRNYGAFWGGGGATIGVSGGSSRGEGPFSEPEIQSMRDLLTSNQVVVALSNHTPDAKVLRVPSAAEEPIPADVVPYDSLAQALGGDLKWPAGPWPKIYYVASGTLEETAYYTSGTFAFTFENAPGQRSFHPGYSFVIDQYHGTGAYPGSSARAGFLRLLGAAANPALHSVLNVRAPSGAKLTIAKKFTMETSPVINADSTKGAPLTFPMSLTSSVTMPKGKTQLAWHVNPSVRPSQHAQDWLPESWKVTCTLGGASRSVNVLVKRGATADVDLRRCR
jgi:carboxypeptidase T